jgi:heme A synthase
LNPNQEIMLRIAILTAGLIVCLPAIGVAIGLTSVPGASAAALAAFALLYTPFLIAAILAPRFQDFFKEAAH